MFLYRLSTYAKRVFHENVESLCISIYIHMYIYSFFVFAPIKLSFVEGMLTLNSSFGRLSEVAVLASKRIRSQQIQVIPSQSLTWNLKMVPWNRRFLLETIICRFHVKLGECNVEGNMIGMRPLSGIHNQLTDSYPSRDDET